MTPQGPVRMFLVIAATVGSAAGEEQFAQRFDRDPINLRLLKYIGSNAQGTIAQADSGLIITLSGDKPSGGQPPGVATRCKVEGDFEITVGYYLDKVETPKKGFGTGVVLRLWKSDGPRPRVNLSRLKHPTDGNVFVTNVWINAKDGVEQDREPFPSEGDQGQLRIVGTGSSLTFLVADGEDDSFHELRQAEFGSEPLSTVQLFGTTGGSRQPVRVRFTHFSICADHLPIGLPVKQETFVWSTWAVFGTTGVLVLLAAYVWSKRR